MNALWRGSGLVLLIGACVLSCASYQGSARDVSPQLLAEESGWVRIEQVPLVRQRGTKDCGAAALSSVLRYWEPASGDGLSLQSIDASSRRAREEGLAARELRDYARKEGFFAYVFKGSFEDLRHELSLRRPAIVGMHKPLSSGKVLAHYEVLLGYHAVKQQVLTFDPAYGLRQNSLAGFMHEWNSTGRVTLVIMPPNHHHPVSMVRRVSVK